MEEYKPNSNKSREEKSTSVSEKNIEKIISGNARLAPKSGARKMADVFISEDLRQVKSYILMDVLVPAVKKAISDIVTNGIDMILYGEAGRSKQGTPSSRVSYRSYYDRRDERGPVRIKNGYDLDNIMVDTRGEADDVISKTDDLMATYNIVSVADLYDLVGITCNYTDNKYGWKDIRNARVIPVRDGYMIKMPKPLPLD